MHIFFYTALIPELGSIKKPSEINIPQNISGPAHIIFHVAVVQNNATIVKQYTAMSTNLNEQEAAGQSTPLITATLFGHTNFARMILAAGPR